MNYILTAVLIYFCTVYVLRIIYVVYICLCIYLCVNVSSNTHTNTHTYTVGTENIVYCPGCVLILQWKMQKPVGWILAGLVCESRAQKSLSWFALTFFIAKIRYTLGYKHSFEHLLCISVGGPGGVCISLSFQTFPVTSCSLVQGFSCFRSCAVITLFIAMSYDILSHLIKSQFPKSGISEAKNIFKIFNFWTWKILFYICLQKGVVNTGLVVLGTSVPCPLGCSWYREGKGYLFILFTCICLIASRLNHLLVGFPPLFLFFWESTLCFHVLG